MNYTVNYTIQEAYLKKINIIYNVSMNKKGLQSKQKKNTQLKNNNAKQKITAQ